MVRKVKELDPYIKARVGEALLKLDGLTKPSNKSGTSRLYYTGNWSKDLTVNPNIVLEDNFSYYFKI